MFTFSILIPTYNSAGTLAVALESIAAQTETSVEVILQDGNSGDNTVELAKSFGEKLPGLRVYSEKDKGIYDAMNKAMVRATGDWLIFLGSDDVFHSEDVLEKVGVILSDTNAHVLYGNAMIKGDTGWAKDGDIYDGPFDLPKLLNQNICHQAMFYRRSFVVNEIGEFNTDYKKSSDWDFNFRCWAKKPFEYVDMIIADFAAGGFSTHSNDTRIVEDFVDNLMNYFQIDLFHPLINTPTFIFYPMVLEKQKREAPFRFKVRQWRKRILGKFK